jgi:hypothetical protein
MDSISLEKNAVYDLNGITATSNNAYVVPRDSNGQIIIQSSSLLIIEGIDINYLSKSIVPLIDTQFRYFSFPARTSIVNDSLINLNLDLDFDTSSLDLTSQTQVDPSGNDYYPVGTPGVYDGEIRSAQIMLPTGEQVSVNVQWSEANQNWVQA